MKMRNLVSAFFMVATIAIQAQEGKWGASPADSVKCWENYNNFGSLMQTRSYVAAYEHWNYVYTNCPAVKKNTFIYAPRILKAMIAEAATPEDKEKYINQLIESYDKRLQYFPGKEAYVTGEKALQIWKYKKDYELSFKNFEEAYALNRSELTPAQVNGYFLSAVKMKNAKLIELDRLIQVYLRMGETVAENRILLTNKIDELEKKKESTGGTLDSKDTKSLKNANTSLKAYTTVESNMNIAISPILTCNNLSLFINEESFEENKLNKKWLGRAAKMLQNERTNEEGEVEDCTDNPMFIKIAKAMVDLEPTSGGYRALAKTLFKEKKYSEAASFYNKALEHEEDPEYKSKDYLAAADCYRRLGSLAKAKQYSKTAISLKSGWGDPYLMLAQIYASAGAEGTCGKDIVEKKGAYWAAINMCYKAKSVDASKANMANKLISVYQKGVPQKSTAFQLGYKAGDTLNLGCWINEVVTIKFY